MRFVVPETFRGVIEISCDKIAGVKLQPQNNVCMITVPADGKVRVVSFDSFDKFHLVTAVRVSGVEIPVVVGPSGANGVVAFHVPGKSSISGVETWSYLVGTPEDADNFYK